MLITTIVGIFNIFVGVLLVLSILTFFGALVGWAIRLGVWPGYRDEMIHLMMWANAMMFVLVVLLAAVHFIQAYQAVAAFLLGIVIFFALAWLILQAASQPKEEEDHH